VRFSRCSFRAMHARKSPAGSASAVRPPRSTSSTSSRSSTSTAKRRQSRSRFASNSSTRRVPSPARRTGRNRQPAGAEALARNFGAGFSESPGSVDRRAEIETLVLGLLDQHHGLERVDVVDPLLLALGRDLRLVRPVVELHLRDAGDLAHLTEVELNLVEMLGEVDGLEEFHVLAVRHVTSPCGWPCGW